MLNGDIYLILLSKKGHIKMEKILFVGGTFNNDLNDKGLYGKKSGLVNKFYNNFKNKIF